MFKLEFTTIIPATPGFTVINFVPAEGEYPCSYQETPIIAWAVETADVGKGRSVAVAHPICPDVDSHTDDDIKYPDGKVVSVDGSSFDSVAEWLEFAKVVNK